MTDPLFLWGFRELPPRPPIAKGMTDPVVVVAGCCLGFLLLYRLLLCIGKKSLYKTRADGLDSPLFILLFQYYLHQRVLLPRAVLAALID